MHDNKRGPLAGQLFWATPGGGLEQGETYHRWWSQAELRSATEQVWPEDLAEMLIKAGIWEAQSVEPIKEV